MVGAAFVAYFAVLSALNIVAAIKVEFAARGALLVLSIGLGGVG